MAFGFGDAGEFSKKFGLFINDSTYNYIFISGRWKGNGREILESIYSKDVIKPNRKIINIDSIVYIDS
ncbi:MAG: hypothetical protein Kow0068_09090 [Marinilabiliales bacterium]